MIDEQSVKERPILFSGPMVRATLDGRKTHTRRVIKSPFGKRSPIVNLADHGMCDDYSGKFNDPDSWGYPFAEEGNDMPLSAWPELNPFGMPRDRDKFNIHGSELWVKETWQGFRQTSIIYDEWEEMESPKDRHEQFYEPVYKADNKNFPEKWQPSIFMPREYSRIQLEITDVRPERLQDISEADAVREGALVCSTGLPPGVPPVYGFDTQAGDFDESTAAYSARDAFAGLWRSLNTKPGTTWEENPWVWAIEFKRIKP